jgi:hypothetical protein
MSSSLAMLFSAYYAATPMLLLPIIVMPLAGIVTWSPLAQLACW